MKALLRVAAVWNTAVACNVASADLMISSPLLSGDYTPVRPDFGDRPTESFTGSSSFGRSSSAIRHTQTANGQGHGGRSGPQT